MLEWYDRSTKWQKAKHAAAAELPVTETCA